MRYIMRRRSNEIEEVTISPSSKPEESHLSIETLTVLDMDRTLLDTTTTYQLLFDSVARYANQFGIDMDDYMQNEEKNRGRSFAAIQVLRKHLYDHLMLAGLTESEILEEVQRRLKQIKDRFIGLAQGGLSTVLADRFMLEDGAQEVLQKIPRHERMILTYGADREWQEWKIVAAGLEEESYIILSIEVSKIDYLVDHFDSTMNRFVFPMVANLSGPLYAQKLEMVDDKITNLLPGLINTRVMAILERIGRVHYAPKEHEATSIDWNKDLGVFQTGNLVHVIERHHATQKRDNITQDLTFKG